MGCRVVQQWGVCGTDTAESTAIGKTKEDKEVSSHCVAQDCDIRDRGLWGTKGS